MMVMANNYNSVTINIDAATNSISSNGGGISEKSNMLIWTIKVVSKRTLFE